MKNFKKKKYEKSLKKKYKKKKKIIKKLIYLVRQRMFKCSNNFIFFNQCLI